MSPKENDRRLHALLGSTRRIAVVGIKDGATDDAHRVPLYLQRAGFEIVPVNPKLSTCLGETCFPDLGSVEGPIDLVNLFRASEHVPGHVDEILALEPRPKTVCARKPSGCSSGSTMANPPSACAKPASKSSRTAASWSTTDGSGVKRLSSAKAPSHGAK